MFTSPQIAEQIKYVAKSRNTKTGDMLVNLGLSKNALSSMALGSYPKADTLLKMAEYLDVSVDYLLGRSNDSTPLSARGPYQRKFAQAIEELFTASTASDTEAAAMHIESYQDIVDMKGPLLFETACAVADELGISLDEVIRSTNIQEVDW